MQVSTQPNRSSYFLVDNDFVAVNVEYDSATGSVKTISYTFTIYGRLIQALIDGYDEIEVSITNGNSFALNYFDGTSKQNIENSIRGFVENTKNKFSDFITQNAYSNSTISIKDFLPDDIIAGIGNGIINNENYREYLPDVETFNSENQAESRVLQDDVTVIEQSSFSQKSALIFERYGISPIRVANIPHPVKMPPESRDLILQTNADVYGYYQEFFSSGDMLNKTLEVEKNKAEFQKFQITQTLTLEVGTTTETLDPIGLLSATAATLRLELPKDGVIFDEFVVPFDNSKPYISALNLKPDDLGVEINTVDDGYGGLLYDEITITNKTTIPIFVGIMLQHFDSSSEITYKLLENKLLISQNETRKITNDLRYPAGQIQSYAIRALKAISTSLESSFGFTNNVYTCVTPQIKKGSSESVQQFNMCVEPTSTNYPKITVLGFRTSDDAGMIYRLNKTTNETALVGKVTKLSPTLLDRGVNSATLYEYTMRYQKNESVTGHGVSTVFVSSNFLNSPASFTITDNLTLLNSTGEGGSSSGGYKHQFKIVESINPTAAKQLLDSVNSSGESFLYQNELESGKTETSFITKYRITRYSQTYGMDIPPTLYDAGETLSFDFTRSYDTYKYHIEQLILQDSLVRYETVVTEQDVNGNTYSFRNKKYRDPTKNKILPSNLEVVNDDVESVWGMAPVTSRNIVEFETGNLLGSISNLRGTARKSSNIVELTWNYNGDISHVMNFFVFATINGVSAPIGSAIHILNSTGEQTSNFTYAHDLSGINLDQAQVITYEVFPVLINNIIQDSAKVIVDVTTDYPAGALL